MLIVKIMLLALLVGALLGWHSSVRDRDQAASVYVDRLTELEAEQREQAREAAAALDRRKAMEAAEVERRRAEAERADERPVKSSIECLLNGHVCVLEWVAIVDSTFVVFGGEMEIGASMRKSGSLSDGSLGSNPFGMLEAMRVHRGNNDDDEKNGDEKDSSRARILAGADGALIHENADALDDDDAIEWVRSEWPWRVAHRDLDLHAARQKHVAVPERADVAVFFHFHETRDQFTALNDNVLPLLMGVYAAEDMLVKSGAVRDAAELRFDLYSAAAHSTETLSSNSAPVLRDVAAHVFRSSDGRLDWLMADSMHPLSSPVRLFRRLVWIEPRQLRPLEPHTDGHFFFKRAPNLYGTARWRQLVARLYPKRVNSDALHELTLDDLKAGGRAGDIEHRRELQRRLHRGAADHADQRPLAELQRAGEVPPRMRFVVPSTASEALERRQLVGHKQLIRLSTMYVAGGVEKIAYSRHNFRRQVLDTQATDVLMGVADSPLANAVFLPRGSVVVQFSCQCVDADELRRLDTISTLFNLYFIDVPCPCVDLSMFPNAAPSADSCATVDNDAWADLLLRSIALFKQSLRENDYHNLLE
jgi:hypothetical protein